MALKLGAASRVLHPLSTQIVGSYVKPAWLIRHEERWRFDASPWRIEEKLLPMAIDDAVRLAIYDQEAAGLDLVTDGEVRRTAYDRYFYARFAGVDSRTLAQRAVERPDESFRTYREERIAEWRHSTSALPRVTAPIAWPGPLSVADLAFLRARTTRPTKATVIGPLTAAARVADEHYRDPRELALAMADAINAELRALAAAGADVLQLDEPVLHLGFAAAEPIAAEVLERAVAGLAVPVIVHVCYGYAYMVREKRHSARYADVLALLAGIKGIAGISLEYAQPRHEPDLLRHCGDKHVVLGLLDLADLEVESAELIADRLRAALDVVPAARLHAASDCGMWHLPRDVAFGKIATLVAGTGRVRRERGLA